MKKSTLYFLLTFVILCGAVAITLGIREIIVSKKVVPELKIGKTYIGQFESSKKHKIVRELSNLNNIEIMNSYFDYFYEEENYKDIKGASLYIVTPNDLGFQSSVSHELMLCTLKKEGYTLLRGDLAIDVLVQLAQSHIYQNFGIVVATEPKKVDESISKEPLWVLPIITFSENHYILKTIFSDNGADWSPGSGWLVLKNK